MCASALVIAVLLFSVARRAAAEDAVYLSTPSNPQGTVKHTGRVIDYTGRDLVIETDGQQRRFPSDQVARIESEWNGFHQMADELFAKGEFEAAITQYEAALKAENRLWVERKIASQMILALRNLGQTRRAGDLFLTLYRSDPNTPYFAAIPLVWTPGQMATDLEPQARRWLESDLPAARLLGASALVLTNQRAAVVKQLEELSTSKDPRIAALARGLIWNATFAGASENKLRAWGEEIERFPPALQAGPYSVLGRALLQQKHPDEAVLALLRVPTLYGEDRALSANALLLAGQALEQAGYLADAAIVYGELLSEHPRSRVATEARERTKALVMPALAPRITWTPIRPTSANVDERFLDALRQRRLFRLAETFCRNRLNRKDASEATRTELTVELSRTLVDEALQAEVAQRDKLWQQAIDVTNDLIKAAPKNPRQPQLRVQQGLVQLSWGTLLRQEAETAGGSAEALAPAREHLRAAIAALREAGAATTEAIRAASPTRKPAPGEWGAAEFRALDKNVRYQTARALRSLAESYHSESADRAGAVTQAVDLLNPLAQLDISDPLAWQSRLDAVTCQRLLGNLDAATRRLDQIDEESPPDRIAARAFCERLRVALAEKRVEHAGEILDKWRAEEHAPLADLDYAALEVFLARWQMAQDTGDKPRAKEWQQQAADAATAIQAKHGGYWGRRAEALLAARVAGKIGPADAVTLARAAEGFYRAGQKDEALAAYDRAAAEARKGAQLPQAFAWEYTAAAIEQEQKHYSAAADRFRRAALLGSQLAKAAEAHLLAIYNQGQQAQLHNDAAALTRYAELLVEHLEKWPTSPTADRVHLLLARVRERERRWPQAAEQYAAVKLSVEAAPEALDGLARAHEMALAELRAAGKPTQQPATAAIADIERLAGAKGISATPTNDAQRRALLAAAKILLEYTTDGAAQAERLIAAALASSTDAPAAWKLSAQGLLLCALAAQGRVDDATAQVAPLAAADPRALVPIIDALERQLASAPAELRRNLAAVELRLIDLATRSADGSASPDVKVAKDLPAVKESLALKARLALDPEESRRLSLLRGGALIVAGRAEEGVAELKRLAAENPRDGLVQETLARAQFDTKDPAALAAWQAVEKKSRPGGERWLRAKYYQALIAERQGDKLRAAQMIKLLQLRYPTLGGGEQEEKFQQLLKRCQ